MHTGYVLPPANVNRRFKQSRSRRFKLKAKQIPDVCPGFTGCESQESKQFPCSPGHQYPKARARVFFVTPVQQLGRTTRPNHASPGDAVVEIRELVTESCIKVSDFRPRTM